MICSLLIMTIIFINGIESAKQKVKHLDAVWKEDEIDAKTKAWLLMVETGKVDEEELRRITPKSIFIAPLLTSRTGKCQEGYGYDHLGQCVKIIKPDPQLQLEMLLKKLSSLYSDKREDTGVDAPSPFKDPSDVGDSKDGGEKGFSEPSNGPLQFSIPILNDEEKNIKAISEETSSNPPPPEPPLPPPTVPPPMPSPVVNSSDFLPSQPLEFIPVPLPMIMLNRTMDSISRSNRTEDLEYSGSGPLNDTEPFLTTAFDDADIMSSGDYQPRDEGAEEVEEEMVTTTPESLFLEDSD